MALAFLVNCVRGRWVGVSMQSEAGRKGSSQRRMRGSAPALRLPCASRCPRLRRELDQRMPELSVNCRAGLRKGPAGECGAAVPPRASSAALPGWCGRG